MDATATGTTQQNLDNLGFAVWGTQAGGLAKWSEDKQTYVWHELPEWASSYADGDPDKPVIGEPIHPEVDTIPANSVAEAEMHSALEAAWR